MFNHRFLSLSVAGLLTLVPCSSFAAPDDFCVPQANGVPGSDPDYPQWWDSTIVNKEVRWTGSTVRRGSPATSSSALDIASIRSIWDAPSRRMFVHVQVKGDPQINPQQDMIAFSFTDASGAASLYMDVRPFLGCVTGTPPNPAAITSLAFIDDTCETGTPASSPSLADTAVMFASPDGTGTGWNPRSSNNPSTLAPATFPIVPDNVWVDVEQDMSGAFNWSLKLAIELPVDGTTNQVDPNVRMYGSTFVAFQTSGVSPISTFQFPLLCEPASSTGSCEMNHGAATDILPNAVPMDTTEWLGVQTGPGGDCEGIELLKNMVGSGTNTVSGTLPGSSTAYEYPGRTLNAVSGSSLWAGFHNDTSNAIGSGAIEAEFRIANWGLTYADWGDAAWTIVAKQPLVGSVPAGLYAGQSGAGEIKSSPYVAGSVPTNPHQCMHVRLASTPSGGETHNFKVDSVYRNMDFVNASVVQRPADINVIGRPLGPGQSAHPVYLWVRPHNMPSPSLCEEYKNNLPGCYPINLDETPDAIDQLPRYTVHGFVDSGRKINLPGAPQTSILSPFSSYGYYVQHEENNIEGWEHSLKGAEPVSGVPNLYRVDVQDGRVATVIDTIRVIDDETLPCDAQPPPSEDPPVVEPPGGGGPVGGGVVDDGPGSGPIGGTPTPIIPTVDKKPFIGCEPPAIRPQCAPDACEAHDVCSFIESSEFPFEGIEPSAGGPPDSETPSTCCFKQNETPQQEAGGAAGTSCLFVLMWGLRRRRRRRA